MFSSHGLWAYEMNGSIEVPPPAPEGRTVIPAQGRGSTGEEGRINRRSRQEDGAE
jgi:hypothetical protein